MDSGTDGFSMINLLIFTLGLVARVGLEGSLQPRMTEFMIFWPLPPECWDCRPVLPHPFYPVLGMEPRAFPHGRKHFTNGASVPALVFILIN